MNKKIYLDSLEKAISSLPQDEVSKTLAYYSEIIDDRIEDGITEEEAVASLEPVEILAQRIIAEYNSNMPAPRTQPRAKAAPKKRSGAVTALIIIMAVLASPVWLPLLLVGAVIAIGIFCVLFALIIAIAALVLGLAVSGIYLLIYVIINPGIWGIPIIFSVGAALIGVGCCILLAFPAVALIKLIWRGIMALGKKICFWLKKRKGGRNNE